jgi:hypothetical protein
MQFDDDPDLAALLWLLADSKALSHRAIVARVDAEISQRSAVPSWMLDVSLSAGPNELLRVLDRASFAHPMLQDPATTIETLSIGIDAGTVAAEDFAIRVCGLVTSELPGPVISALSELEEEALCCCMHGGVPVPALVAAAAREVSRVVRGISPLAERISSLRAPLFSQSAG